MIGNVEGFAVAHGKCNGGNAVHGRLCRRADGSGVGDVKTRVQPVVDAGQDNIRAEGEQCVQRNLDTIGGRAVYAPGGLHRNREIIAVDRHLALFRDSQADRHAAALVFRCSDPDRSK